MKLKNILTLILGIVLVLSLSACTSNTKPDSQDASVTQPVSDKIDGQDKETGASNTSQQPQTAGTETQQENTTDNNEMDSPSGSGSDVLVVVFSATGTTKGVADKIVSVTGADLYEIIPAEPYSDADLNYNDRGSRSTKEQNDKTARPAIGSDTLDLSGYKTIYIGFPIWWGEEPRIMDTFVESYDFSGIALIPFCTSGGSGIGRSGPNMESLAGSGTWLEGKRFSGNVSEDELRSWIESLQ